MFATLPQHVEHCIDPQYVDAFPRLFPGVTAEALDRQQLAGELPEQHVRVDHQRGVAIVHVRGLLTKYKNGLGAAVGGSALVDVADAIDEVGRDAERGVVIAVDSPGGSVAGLSRVLEAAQGARVAVAGAVGGQANGAGLAVAAAGGGPLFAAPGARLGYAAHCETIVGAIPPAEVSSGGLDPASDVDPHLLGQLGRNVAAHVDDALGYAGTGHTAGLVGHRAVSAEAAHHFGLLRDVIPLEAVIDRVARGDV